MTRQRPCPTLFPYTTLFRSYAQGWALVYWLRETKKLDPRFEKILPSYLEHLLDARLAVDRKSTRLNSSHVKISYAVFCLKKKKRNKEMRSNRNHQCTDRAIK